MRDRQTMWRPWSPGMSLGDINQNSDEYKSGHGGLKNNNEDGKEVASLVSATHKLPQVTWFLQPSKEPTKLILRRRQSEIGRTKAGLKRSPPLCKGLKRKHSGECGEDSESGPVDLTTTSAAEMVVSPRKPNQTTCPLSNLVPLETKGEGCSDVLGTVQSLVSTDLGPSTVDAQKSGNPGVLKTPDTYDPKMTNGTVNVLKVPHSDAGGKMNKVESSRKLEQFCKKIPEVIDGKMKAGFHVKTTIINIEPKENIVVVDTEHRESNKDFLDESQCDLIIHEESADEDVGQQQVEGIVPGDADISVPLPKMLTPQPLPVSPNVENSQGDKEWKIEVNQPLESRTVVEASASFPTLKDRVSSPPPLIAAPTMIPGFPFPVMMPTGDPRALTNVTTPFMQVPPFAAMGTPMFPSGMSVPYPMMHASPFWPQMGYQLPVRLPPNVKSEKSPPVAGNVQVPIDMTSPLNLRKSEDSKDDHVDLSSTDGSPPAAAWSDTAPPKKRRRVVGPKRRLNAKAVELMQESFRRDRYPTAEEKERLALDGGISVQQVNSWFTNYRRKLDYGRGTLK